MNSKELNEKLSKKLRKKCKECLTRNTRENTLIADLLLRSAQRLEDINKEIIFVPITPGGSLCMHLEADTEDKAWENLLKDAFHMPYKTKENFIKRGYTVEEM